METGDPQEQRSQSNLASTLLIGGSATGPREDDDDPEAVAMMRRLQGQLFDQTYEPVRVGRFTLLRRIGSGAMGVVYQGYDDVLDRTVALKLIRHGSSSSEEEQGRLLREAQAMARVSHPNVVPVYEAGPYPGGVFIAMEFIAGQTLRAWLDDADGRPWSQTLATLLEAGQGLVAAHREGVIHRDFKPDNVLLTRDGAPKVVDFGLAGLLERVPELETADEGMEGLARTRAMMGSPRYMSPEQFEAEPATARSDQFAFCVVAYEALYGQRPFEGQDLPSLATSVVEGKLQPLPTGGPVPRRIGAAILRGLSRRPDDRWPSMDALLHELTPRRRSRWWWGAGGLLVAGIAAGSWMSGRNPPCTESRARLHGVWDAERRGAIEAAFGEVGTELAIEVWGRIAPRVDAYADDWVQMHTRACEMTRVHGEQSEAVLDLRMGCLHRARTGLSASLDVLAQPDADAVANADRLVAALPELSRCADVDALLRQTEPPSQSEAPRVELLRARVARVEALTAAGKYDDALAEALEARDELATVDYGPIRTEVMLALGWVQSKRLDEDAAEAGLLEAQTSAMRHGQWPEAVRAGGLLAFTLGARLNRYDEAHMVAATARSLAEYHGEPKLQARVEGWLAAVLTRQGRFEEAVDMFHVSLERWPGESGTPDEGRPGLRRSLAIALLEWGKYDEAETEIREALARLEANLGERHPRVADGYHTLGNVLRGQGRTEEAGRAYAHAVEVFEAALPGHPELALLRLSQGDVWQAQGQLDRAIALYRSIIEQWEPTLGPHHASIGASRNNLASVLLMRGQVDEALPLLRAVLDSRIQTMGPDHPDVARARANVGSALVDSGRPDEAEVELRTAVEVAQRAFGPDSPHLARLHGDLGTALADQGQLDEAAQEYRRALSILEATGGSEHASAGYQHNNLATIHLEREQYEDAERELRRALEVWEKALAPDHPHVAKVLLNLGRMALLQERFDACAEPLERSLSIYDRHGAPLDFAHVRHALAECLWYGGGDRGRAAELARLALDDFGRSPPHHADVAVASLREFMQKEGIRQ